MHKLKHNEYIYYKNNVFCINREILFIKDCLVDISNNLVQLNRMKVFDMNTHGYNTLYHELNLIKMHIDKLPTKININFLKKTNNINQQLIDIKLNLLECINHIAPHDMRITMRMLLGLPFIPHNNMELLQYFNIDDINILELLFTLFNPINIWDSYYHTNIIKYKEYNMNDIGFNKETIETLIDSNNLKVKSILMDKITHLPMFLKNLSELVLPSTKKEIKYNRTNHFDYMHMMQLFTNENNIIICKNPHTTSLVEEKLGMMVLMRFKFNNVPRLVILQGIVRDDIFELYKSNELINSKLNIITNYIDNEYNLIPKIIRMNHINILNIRDIMIYSKEEIGHIIKERYNDYMILSSKPLSIIINDFLLASKSRKVEILTLLLLSGMYDNKLGFILYDILKIKDKSNTTIDIYNSLHSVLKSKLDNIENIMKTEEEAICDISSNDISYERRIIMMPISTDIKSKAIDKLKSLKTNFQGDNKAQVWLDGFLKIPFGVYRENNIISFKKKFIKQLENKYILTNPLYSFNEVNNYIKLIDNNMMLTDWNNYVKDKAIYLNNIKQTLDKAVYGHNDAKLTLQRLFAQWINGETKGSVLGLCGPPGTGKTSLIKNGLSKCLVDIDGKPRPFGFIPIGGSTNGSTLVGHNYTYLGSTWGRIADILMIAGCMNPIIFIDEIDKVSNTESGREIISILTHLTDSTQNESFEDKYYANIPLDLSKALIVFSFNDISMIDPILKDRITIIETKPYTLNDKINIIMKYMIPEVLIDTGFSCNELIFTEDIICYIINTFTNEAGVRKVKEKIIDIIRDINLTMIYNNINIPFIITREYIDNLFRNQPKMQISHIHANPEVGLVNGLYATTSGVGGLTIIQVIKYPSEKMMELTITGQQGDVMKESVEYALKIAFNLLSDDIKTSIIEDSRNKKNFGLFVHTPDAATKKEGPSAGAAMTLAIYSVLSNKKVNNTIAMTGEIDLWKNIKQIGGVQAKLMGAKNAGIKLALIPHENIDDLNILRNEYNSPEDNNFIVQTINTIEDVIKYCIVE